MLRILGHPNTDEPRGAKPMMSLAHRAISGQPWAALVVQTTVVLVIVSALASAQRTVGPPVVVRPPVAPMPVSPAPVYRPPIVQTPIARLPITTSPIYITPRSGIVSYPGRVP